MKKEEITIREKDITVQVVNTKINAVRKRDITKKGYRVFENGKIGVSGTIGDDTTLLKDAIDNLQTNISYIYPLEKNHKECVHIKTNTLSSEEFLNESKKLLTYNREHYSNFDFSNNIQFIEKEVCFKNSENVELVYKDSYVELELIMREKKSANIFDGFLTYIGRYFTAENFIEKNKGYIEAYKNKIKLPELDRIPVIINFDEKIASKLNKELNGERYGNGSSLFAGKLGKQLFNEKINITHCFDPVKKYRQFFDSEGIVNDGYEYTLIKNGLLKACFTNKKIADKYQMKHTGAASSGYDSAPGLNHTTLDIKIDSHNLREAINGFAIFVMVAAGGDFTDDGAYATPVQIAFLYDGEKLIGKLPEFQMSSHLMKMFGDDYIGTFESPFHFGDNDAISVFMMDIQK